MFNENAVESTRILYTPSPFAKSSLLHLQETGTLTALRPHTSTRAHLTSYLFFVVLAGNGTLHYDGKDFFLSTGDCVFINCENAYSHATEDSLWKLQWAHFNGENLADIYQKYMERGGQFVFHPEHILPYTNLLTWLYTTAKSEDFLRDMRINELLSSLLTRIMEMSWQPEKKEEIKRGVYRQYSLQDVKKHLEDNWTKKIVLDELANRFYINKYYLTRLFKNQYGVSILTYVIELRITHAKELLRFSKKSVECIGIECGFDDANYFSRVFKRVEGTSPGEYRKMWVQ